MAKTMFVALCVVLLGTIVSADFNSRCPNPTGRCTATAFASATVVSTGGSCAVRSISNAFCGTFVSELQGCYTLDTLYDQDTCRSTRPRDDAKCYITVAAAAFASAFVRAECTDGSIGCGSANSAADAEIVGCYVANTIVDLAKQLGTNTPECETAVVDAVNAMVSAAAEAEASACSTSGVLGLDADFSFDGAVRKIVSNAFKTCWLYCGREETSPAAKAAPSSPSPEQSKTSDTQGATSTSATASAEGEGASAASSARATSSGGR